MVRRDQRPRGHAWIFWAAALLIVAAALAAIVAGVRIELLDGGDGGAGAGGGGAGGTATASAAVTKSHRGSQAIRISVNKRAAVGISKLSLGVTHTQHSLDPWGDPASIARGEQLLRFAQYQNQHLYGWGTQNPEPAPGVYDWRTLDRRVAMIRRLGGKPFITLCCAPDWMTKLGTNTTTFPNLPPTPDHYDDFAELAKRVAERYPDVHRFLVWNEMKGFWDPHAKNWDYRAYTELYNRVYRAVKSVNRQNLVGGPYLVIEGTGAGHAAPRSWATANPITSRDWTVLDYWLRHKAGADFIAIDRKLQSRHDTNHYSKQELLGFTRWFQSITEQIRRRTNLAVMFAEDYFVDSSNERFQAAGLAAMLVGEIRGGAAISLRWGPQGTSGESSAANGQSLFTDTRRAGGGRPLPAWRVYDDVARAFPRDTTLVRARSSSRAVEVLASRRYALLINRTPRVQDVRVQKRTKLRMAPWAVRLQRLR